jgi:hypothetical protein
MELVKPGSLSLWVIVALVLGLNFWFDYYHPLGLIFDLLVGVVLLFRYLIRPDGFSTSSAGRCDFPFVDQDTADPPRRRTHGLDLQAVSPRREG